MKTGKSNLEKDIFLKAYEREFNTTLRVLNAYPEGKLDLKGDNLRSAGEIAFRLIGEQAVADMAMKGKIEFNGEPPVPNSKADIITPLKAMFQNNLEKIKNLTDEEYNSLVTFPEGPDNGKVLRKADVFWLTLYDMVHHRGQLSVYLRLAGGKVPSIYGPSADETENVFLV